MEKSDLIIKNENSLGNWAVDGLLYGLVSGTAMLLVLAVLALFSGSSPGAVMEHFSASNSLTSPIQGLLNHLAVSAIYGVLFGALIWPLLHRLSPSKRTGWFFGVGYGLLLFGLAQIAILPGVNSPLAQLPVWEWAIGHAIYGLVLGGQFSRKV